MISMRFRDSIGLPFSYQEIVALTLSISGKFLPYFHPLCIVHGLLCNPRAKADLSLHERLSIISQNLLIAWRRSSSYAVKRAIFCGRPLEYLIISDHPDCSLEPWPADRESSHAVGASRFQYSIS